MASSAYRNGGIFHHAEAHAAERTRLEPHRSLYCYCAVLAAALLRNRWGWSGFLPSVESPDAFAARRETAGTCAFCRGSWREWEDDYRYPHARNGFASRPVRLIPDEDFRYELDDMTGRSDWHSDTREHGWEMRRGRERGTR